MRGHHTHFAGAARAHYGPRAGRFETGKGKCGDTILISRERHGHTTAGERAGLKPGNAGTPYSFPGSGMGTRRPETGPYERGFRIRRGSQHTARVISDYGRDMSLPYKYKATQQPESRPV